VQMSQPPIEIAPEAMNQTGVADEWNSATAQDRPYQAPAPWPVMELKSSGANTRSISTPAVVLAASLIPFVIGAAAGYIVAGSVHPTTTVQTRPAQYAQVRAANIGPLEQALSHIPADCSGPDPDRCTLSIAYALALTQKFQAELPLAPSCFALSDARLRTALVELDGSLHAAALDNALGRLLLAGETELAASDAQFSLETCAASSGSSG
jgi:hypothetical protein